MFLKMSSIPLQFHNHLEPEDIYILHLISEHQDFNLHYINTCNVSETPDEPSFSLPFNSLPNTIETFRKTYTF